jgi:SAM-dependent methyltransferase
MTTKTGTDDTTWRLVARVYHSYGPPFRPSAADLAVIATSLGRWAERPDRMAANVLLLGVTPDIATLVLPYIGTLTAVDSSSAMIEAVWPGDVPNKRHAICADWQELPTIGRQFDAVVGDGVVNLVPYPSGLRSLMRAVKQVLAHDGQFIVRCFVQPRHREDPAFVVSELFRGSIASFSQFELRLLMAAQLEGKNGMTLDEACTAWLQHTADAGMLTPRTEWDAQAAETIDRWRGSGFLMAFPTIDDLRTLVNEQFQEVAISYPSYDLGERCPTLVLRPRETGGL